MFGVYKIRNLSYGETVGVSAASGASIGTSISPGYGTAIGAIIGAGYGLFQAESAKSRAEKLAAEEKNKFTENPELTKARLAADEAAKQGFTNQQNALWFQNLHNLSRIRQQNAQETAGGWIGGAIRGGNTANELTALNQRAGQDSILKQQNQRYADTFKNTLQSLQNMQTSADQHYRLLREQALGQAAQNGQAAVVGNLQVLGQRGGDEYDQWLEFKKYQKAQHNQQMGATWV